ncbi:MAG: serine/threonine protein kinase [Planctomycetes bacterium]|nr:serine/threonine protein kinase [Planctomycetota bacterium]
MSDIPNHDASHSSDAQPTRTHAGSSGVSTFPDSTLPAPGTFPGYDVLSELNRGGQGVVYLARQHGTLRDVAIKVPLGDALASTIGLARFQREIESVARLRHTNVVSVFHPGRTSDGRPFFVMEYVDGLPLITHIQTRGLTTREIVALAAEVCDGLDAAHCAGVIHRDLKPGNILVDRGGHPRILDFGLARSLDPNPAEAISTSRQIMGTLAYMAPEQARGDHPNTAECTDIHAIGVILFQALTGALPFPTDKPDFLLLQAIIHDPPLRPSAVRKEIRGDLETIILKCLAKETERRYVSAVELAEDLRRYLRGEAIHAKADSTLYIARKQVERAARRHTITAHLAVTVLVVLLMLILIDPVLDRRLETNRWIEKWITANAGAPPTPAKLRNVSIVALTDATDVESLASSAGLLGVSTKVPQSLRRLHGHTMKRLAAMRPLVVVWDIKFIGDSPFDNDLAEGFGALREANIPVICAVDGWWSGGQVPRLGSRFAHLVRWGTIFAGFDSSPPQVQLVMQSGGRDALPSLALSAVAAARQPNWEPSYLLDALTRSVTILYYKRDPKMPEMKSWLNQKDRIRLAGLRVANSGEQDLLSTPGIHPEDRIGIHCFQLRSDSVVQQSTLAYSRLYDIDTTATNDFLTGKIVIMADARKGADDHRVAPDRIISGSFAQAAVIEELMNETAIQASLVQPLTFNRFLDSGLFSLLGMVCMLSAPRWGWLMVCGLTAAAASSCILVAARFHMIWNPLVPVLGMIISAILTVFVSRVTRPRGAVR